MAAISQRKPSQPAAPSAELATAALIRATAAAVDTLARELGRHGRSGLQNLVLLGAHPADVEQLRQFLASQGG